MTIDGITKLINFMAIPYINHYCILGVAFKLSIDFQSNQFLRRSGVCAVNAVVGEKFLSLHQRNQLEEVYKCYCELHSENLECIPVLKHHIGTGDAQPVKQRHFPVSQVVLGQIKEELGRMLSLGVPSHISWSSSIILVKKPTSSNR